MSRGKKLLELLVLAPYIILLHYHLVLEQPAFERGVCEHDILKISGFRSSISTRFRGSFFVMGICNIPVVYLLVVGMLRKIPADMEWAGRTSGYTPLQTIRKITMVQAMPAIASGGMLAFLASIDNFSIPAFLGISSGIPVLSTYIYEKAISFGPDSFHKAAALSVVLSFIAIGGTLLQGRLIRKNSNLESVREDTSVRYELPVKWRRIFEWGSLTVLAGFTVVPVLSMIMSAFLKNYGTKFRPENLSIKNFQFVFTNAGVRQAVVNSILLAVVTCIICIVAGTATAYLKVRKNSKAARMFESAASLTYALPGIVLALAMIFHWTIVPGVYGTVKILMIAYATRYVVLQIKGKHDGHALRGTGAGGSGKSVRSRKSDDLEKDHDPGDGKADPFSAFLIFVSSLTELTLSSMLASAGTKTIGLTIFNLQQGGDYSLSAAMSAVIVFIVFLYTA